MGEDSKKNEALDKGLKETFPASDPVNVASGHEPDRPVERQPAPIDHELVERLAEQVRQKQVADDGDRQP